MGLRIVNNIAAQNAHRWLSTSDAAMAKSLERLSSGYRINRAADDAAGLAISSGFRADIASFKVASRNTTEANALLQVAEGGIEQISNMLVRLKELATQAASANVGTAERSKLNAEGNALISEIDRIANSTKYGSTMLLDGTFGSSKSAALGAGTAVGGVMTGQYVGFTFSHVATGTAVAGLGTNVAEGTTWYLLANTGVNTGAAAAAKLYIMNAATYSTATLIDSYSGSLTDANTAVAFANLGITISITGSLSGIAVSGAGAITAGATTGAATALIGLQRTGLSSLSVEGAVTGTFTFDTSAANYITLGNGTVTETVAYVANSTHTFSNIGINFYLSGATEGYDDNDLEGMTITVSSSGSAGSTFQVGAKNDVNNRISLSIGNVVGSSTSGLNLTVDMLDTASEAQSMLDLVDSAISTLSSRRGDIGSYMNRLSYAAANLAITIENVQSAESVIRDVDMAAEMTTFTKNQILLQAGTAMLAQANTAPQSLLSLFGR